MDNFFVLLLIISCVGIWYFIKKKPNKQYRNFAIGATIASLVLFGVFIPSSKKESTKKEDDSSVTTSSETKIVLKMDDSFETDSSGEVTITGKTTPKAKITIGFGILNDPVEANDKGDFSIKYSLSSDKDEQLNIISSMDNDTTSKSIEIKPSAEFIAARKAEETKKTEEAKKEEEANISDITVMSEKPTSKQQDILSNLAQQQFEQEFPYKGSKMKTAIGVIQPWTTQNGQWYYKVEAVIVNQYGTKQDANVEIHIQPQSATTGNVEIIAY